MKKPAYLRLAVHIGAWIPLAWLAWDYWAGNLSVNPIQDLTQRSGRYAITLLVLSLAATPANTLFGFRHAVQVRRALGLYAFMYAAIHLLTFVWLDFGFAWGLLARELVEKPYIWLGLSGFLMLAALAVTSTKASMRSMGKNWRRLHSLVYLAAPLLVLHFAWANKGDLLRLAGDIAQPLAYGVVLIFLLSLRLPPVRRQASRVRDRLKAKLRSRARSRSQPPPRSGGPPSGDPASSRRFRQSTD